MHSQTRWTKMIPGFQKLIEDRIKKAEEKGAFKNLKGAGKPLELADDSHIPEDLRMAHKILKNADCLPPEIELKKQILQTEELLAAMTDEADRYRMLKKINLMINKLNTMQNGAIAFELPQQYMAALAERFGPKKSATSNESKRPKP
jgi:hypothetical protein